jgi:hypothetical protein
MPTKRARILEELEDSEEDTISPGEPDGGDAEHESAQEAEGPGEVDDSTDTHIEPSTVVHSQTPGNEALSLASDPSE